MRYINNWGWCGGAGGDSMGGGGGAGGVVYYINMISNSGISEIEDGGLSFNDLYVVSKSSGASKSIGNSK